MVSHQPLAQSHTLGTLPQAIPTLVTTPDTLWPDAFHFSFTRSQVRPSRRTAWTIPSSKESAASVAAHPTAPASARARGRGHPQGLIPFSRHQQGSSASHERDVTLPSAGWNPGRKHHDGQRKGDENGMDAQSCFPIPFSSTALFRSVSHSMSSHFQPGGHSISSLGRTFSPFCGMQGCFQPNGAQQTPKSPQTPISFLTLQPGVAAQPRAARFILTTSV